MLSKPEDRYKYIINLGKELPAMDPAKKDELHLVRGCQSQVWIDCKVEDCQLWFEANCHAFIVKGLLGVVVVAYSGKPADAVRAFDVDEYFNSL